MYQGIKHDKIAVVGSGYTIKQYAPQLRQYISDYGYKVIGINFMTSLCCPDYHLWTNKKQYSNLGQCIDTKKSVLMFSYRMPRKLIRKHCSSDYKKVIYSDSDEYKDRMVLSEQHIKGRFRTAGCLAISIAYLMEANDIIVAGMDGFTLHNQKLLNTKQKNQHCYGSGYTDDATWKQCIIKDNLVSKSLDQMSKIIQFKIITPTVFNKHYDASILVKQ